MQDGTTTGDFERDMKQALLNKTKRRLPALTALRQATRDKRPGFWDQRRFPCWLSAFLVISVVSAFTLINTLTMQADRPHTPAWEIWTWSITSAIFTLGLIWIPWIAARLASPGQTPWPALIPIHLAVGVVYSGLHVAGFVAARNLVYALAGETYGLGPLLDDFPYELRKDLLTYGSTVALFWLTRKDPAPATQNHSPTLFDIRDGKRITRIEIASLLAVRGAGNYVEFHLENGSRPLMRITLGALQKELGLVRVHRSWLLNPSRVTGLSPDGSGDWTVQLGSLQVPLSRRYAAALEILRARD